MSLQITRRASLFGVAALGALAAARPALASAPTTDRAAILAMAGDFRVRFDFRETAAFTPDYTPLEPKLSGGHESVRVVEDRGDFIMLQHLLVAEHEGRTFVIKHWRQDWTYEPRSVLVYTRANRWDVREVSAAERAGAWSQTVWQTDDSPRYGGVGRWAHENGATVWTSGRTLRPLARRDAIRHPPYNRYDAINRHAITPFGWIHEQDNSKIGERDGATMTFVHEDGINTYTRFADYPVAAADSYWADTQTYWAGVRAAWDDAIARDNGVSVEEEPENGAVTGPTLMGLAARIHDGEAETAAALAEARACIAQATRV
ncbi:MAG: hypothetical protein HXY28_05980 [Hydrogenophilaceae bacterium]|jgi:hypothetical protein|nr:hypothetical protein [Hydrogenophilaceae bacterium]